MSAPETENPPPTQTAPARARGKGFSRFILLIIFILLSLGALGYGALIFRDKDSRLNSLATLIDTAAPKVQSSAREIYTQLNQIIGQYKDTPPLEKEIDQAAEVATNPPLAPVDKNTQIDPPAAEQKEKPLAAPDLSALTQKIDEAADIARKALKAAEDKSHFEVPAASEGGFTTQEMLAAFEGRLDVLSEDIKTLRQKMDAPKNENRAAPEMLTTPKATVSDASAAIVVIAFALQKELETGRPFADEITALKRLGADTESLTALQPFADSGAPTGEKLREIFLPIAKKIREHEIQGDDLTSHLLHGARKLVRVRPIGQAELDTLEGKLTHIETALGHESFEKAHATFMSLPQEAQSEATSFGEMLQQRSLASIAANNLLHGAITALSGVKK
ncbi:MAG: COG4223 family protein [Methylocystis sp.]